MRPEGWERRLVAGPGDPLWPAAEAALVGDRSGFEGEWFLGVHNPPLRMAVVGAVHIAQALVPMARIAGYDVIVIDPREAFASEARFPGTASHCDCRPGEVELQDETLSIPDRYGNATWSVFGDGLGPAPGESEGPPPPAEGTLTGQIIERGSRSRVFAAMVRCGDAAEAPQTMTDEQRKNFQQNIIDNLVLRKVIDSRLRDGNFRVSEQAVLAEFQNIPAFQDAEGKYDPNQARLFLQQTGKSEREFFDDVRKQLLIDQLQQGLGSSYFLTQAEAQRLFNLENEEREVQYAQLSADAFAGDQPIETFKAVFRGDRFQFEFEGRGSDEERREPEPPALVPLLRVAP